MDLENNALPFDGGNSVPPGKMPDSTDVALNQDNSLTNEYSTAANDDSVPSN